MDYKNGKIYKITNCIDDEVYIGSTCTTLTKRWYEHKKSCAYKPFKIYEHMNKLGIEKFSISLVENYPCTNKTELFRREGEVTKEQGTLNSKIAGRTKNEWAEDNKDHLDNYRKNWYEEHKDNNLEYAKEYRENNKDKVKEYRENNKVNIAERMKEYSKIYRKQNIERLREKIECDICKSMISREYISKHKKTISCKNSVN